MLSLICFSIECRSNLCVITIIPLKTSFTFYFKNKFICSVEQCDFAGLFLKISAVSAEYCLPPAGFRAYHYEIENLEIQNDCNFEPEYDTWMRNLRLKCHLVKNLYLHGYKSLLYDLILYKDWWHFIDAMIFCFYSNCTGNHLTYVAVFIETF